VTDDELKGLFQAMRQEMAEMRQENAEAHAETRRHMDVVIERVDGRIDLLAEALQLVNENLQSKIVALDQKVDKTTAETQGLVKFLYDDVNRWVLVLEGKQKK
jgi:hypothetical protein